MSHYTVGVILKKEDFNRTFDAIEGYNENMSAEEIKERNFSAASRLIEKALEPFDENREVEPYLSTPMNRVKERFEEVKAYDGDDEYKIKLRNNYKDATLDSFIRDYYCQDYNDKGLLSTYNENSKWDWYVIGGRWSGCLPIKGLTSTEDKEYNFFSPGDYDSVAKIKDIKFEKELTFAEIEEHTATYNKLITEGNYLKPEYYLKKYPTLESYLDEEKSFSTYALLTPDGQWHEPGEMGWFGATSATPEDEGNFKNVFRELISQQDEEDYFVLVDCHI